MNHMNTATGDCRAAVNFKKTGKESRLIDGHGWTRRQEEGTGKRGEKVSGGGTTEETALSVTHLGGSNDLLGRGRGCRTAQTMKEEKNRFKTRRNNVQKPRRDTELVLYGARRRNGGRPVRGWRGRKPEFWRENNGDWVQEPRDSVAPQKGGRTSGGQKMAKEGKKIQSNARFGATMKSRPGNNLKTRAFPPLGRGKRNPGEGERLRKPGSWNGGS